MFSNILLSHLLVFFFAISSIPNRFQQILYVIYKSIRIGQRRNIGLRNLFHALYETIYRIIFELEKQNILLFLGK